MSRLPAALFLALFAFASSGCASIDEAYGVPEATSWSYFQASPDEVARAAEVALRQRDIYVETVSETDEGGYILGVSWRNGSSEFEEIRIQPYVYKVYSARAQTYPQSRRLPGAIQRGIASQL